MGKSGPEKGRRQSFRACALSRQGVLSRGVLRRWLLNSCLLAGLCFFGGAPAALGQSNFKRGDSDGDGIVALNDAIRTLNWLFLGGTIPGCLDAADADDDGIVALNDGIRSLNYLFLGGPAPGSPGPTTCGPDPTNTDSLTCLTYTQCPAGQNPPVAVIDSVQPNPAVEVQTVNFTGHGTTTGSIIGFRWRSSVNGQLSTQASFSTSALSVGTHTIFFRVEDNLNQFSTEASVSLRIDQTPPPSDLRDVGHVLNRIAYGPSAADVDHIDSIGLEAFIEEQLNPQTIDESANTALSTRENALFGSFTPTRDTPLVRSGALWHYRKGTSEPPPTWNDPGFVEDALWLTGATGIGYGDGDDVTVLEDMHMGDNPDTPEVENYPGYWSVHMRHTFNVANPAAINSLVLKVSYDDGFVPYLNGVEIAGGRRGLTGTPPPYNRAATSHDAAGFEDIPVPTNMLVAGANVLAIQVHNTALTSSDLTMIPELVDRVVLGPPQRRIGGLTDLQELVHVRGVYSQRQLQAVLAEFWENHFTTDSEKVSEYFDALQNSDATDAMGAAQAVAEAAQVDYLEYQFYSDHALGNFGDLLLYSATSPSMLVYLDNVLNVVRAANENYAREILELSTFGVDNRYLQRDIEQLAKCFTGWTICKVQSDEVPAFPPTVLNTPTDCGVQFTDTVVLALAGNWKYFKGTAEPSPGGGGEATTAWTQTGFNDSAPGWIAGSTTSTQGFGYGDGDDAPTMTFNDMMGSYLTVYARRNFTIADPEALESIVLEVSYDDAFVAYLNGQEVARSENMLDDPRPPAFDDVPDELHEVDAGPQYFNLNRYRGLLLPSPQTNVLSFQVHNYSLGSSDLSMLPRILDRHIEPGSVENGDTGGVWTFRFNPAQHDYSAKTLFQEQAANLRMSIPGNRTGIDGVRDALDVIARMANHPSTQEFVCIKLIQRFVADDISIQAYRTNPQSLRLELRELLAAMISAWNSTNGNIEAVMRVLLNPSQNAGSPLVFWNDVSYRNKVKTPIEYINSTLRALDASASGNNLPTRNDMMGMHLFTRDEPDGWSEVGFDWIDTGSMLSRFDFVQDLSLGRQAADFSWNTLTYMDSRGLDTAQEIVDYFNDLLFEGTLSQTTKNQLLEFLNTDDNYTSVPFSRAQSDFQSRVREFVGYLLTLPEWHFQ